MGSLKPGPVKRTLAQLLVDAMLAVTIFAQITGCAATAGPDDPIRYRLFFPASEQVITNARIPLASRQEHRGYGVVFQFKWSNGYIDGT
jgi:hypothetical protein